MPPPKETTQQRVACEKSETQAKALSDEIDKQLYNDRSALPSKETIRIVLLGSALLPSHLGASLAYYSCSQQDKARVVNPHFEPASRCSTDQSVVGSIGYFPSLAEK
jgi:hypothetical protein